MDDLTLTTKYEVSSAETDMFGRMRLSAFTNLLIQSAIKSADSLGFGWKGMNEQQLFWVLSRITVQISKMPKWYDKISIETWPKDIHKILYLRDYFVRDADDNIIAKATSAWLALDYKTHRPKHVSSEYIGQFTLLKDKHAIVTLPEKLPETEGEIVNEINTDYFDIDMNKHVTSTRYIDWMTNTFSPEFHETNSVRSLSMNYMKETSLGSTISLAKEQSEKNQYHFEGKNIQANSIAFRGKLVY